MCTVAGHLLMNELQTGREQGMPRHIPSLLSSFDTTGQNEDSLTRRPQSNAVEHTTS